MPLSPPPKGSVRLGSLGKTFQLQGGLRFYALGNAEEAAIQKLERVFIEGFGERAIGRVRLVGAFPVVYFVGVSTPQQAQALVNAEVYAARDTLPETPIHYLDLLLELPVTVDGAVFGEVTEVIPAGSDIGQDLLVVEAAGRQVLIPLQADYVTITEVGVTLTRPPEGLLELNQEQQGQD